MARPAQDHPWGCDLLPADPTDSGATEEAVNRWSHHLNGCQLAIGHLRGTHTWGSGRRYLGFRGDSIGTGRALIGAYAVRYRWGHPRPVVGRARDGMPIMWCLANPKIGEREVVAALLAHNLITADYVNWYNQQRLMHRLGRIPPAEAEARYYAQHVTDQPAGSQNPDGA